MKRWKNKVKEIAHSVGYRSVRANGAQVLCGLFDAVRNEEGVSDLSLTPFLSFLSFTFVILLVIAVLSVGVILMGHSSSIIYA